jgi:hypothetical protein
MKDTQNSMKNKMMPGQKKAILIAEEVLVIQITSKLLLDNYLKILAFLQILN